MILSPVPLRLVLTTLPLISGSSRGRGRGRGLTRPTVSRQPAQPSTKAQHQLPPKLKDTSQPQPPADRTTQPVMCTSIPRSVNKDKVGTPAQIIHDNTQRKRSTEEKKADERKIQLQAAAAERLAREKEAKRLTVLAAEEDRLRQEDVAYEVQGIRSDLHGPSVEENCTYLTSTEECLLSRTNGDYYQRPIYQMTRTLTESNTKYLEKMK